MQKQPARVLRQAVSRWFAECRTFFDSAAGVLSEKNWEMLRPMSLLYLGYLAVYLFGVCPVLDIPLQTAALRIGLSAHAVFTLAVWLRGKKAPPVWAVDGAITLFAVQILGLSGFLGVAAFPGQASFLFPLCLVLMTQIYTRRPIYSILEVLLPAAVYLVCCRQTKATPVFLLDAISVFIAMGIAGAALYSLTNYKLRAYHAQLALQKMCALDAMTGVNNKPTFEFLVGEYLSACPDGRHALAICDFDDFKSINDRCGHRVGDRVLEAFAARLHRLTDGAPDLLAGRFGGDEFVVFFKSYGEEREVLEKLSVLSEVPGFGFPVTCSIGVAFSRAGETDFGRYFDAADRSLYRTKNEKPGGIHAADLDRPEDA